MGVRYRQDGRAYVIAPEEAHGDVVRCRKCNARMLFIETPTPARLPLDLDKAVILDNGHLRCPNHYATCPHADAFRKKPRTKGACPAEGCNGRVRESELLCPPCWKRVPKRQRDEVQRTWKAVQAGGGRAQWKSYESAGASAIAAARASKAADKVRQLDAFGDAGHDPG